MKNSVLVLAVLGAFAGVASAQTSNTIYGVADMFYSHDSGGKATGAVNALDSGSLSGSRLGFKGSEDLGGGLSAIYTAEMGFGIDTGAFDATGTGFGRQAFVGLAGNFGVVKLGRQYSPFFKGMYIYDPFGQGLAGAYTRLISLGGGKRLNNTIDYVTPSGLGGFNGEVAYSLGEVAGNNSAGRVIAMTVGYANGPVSANLIYNNSNDVPVASAGIVTTKNTGLGASYDLGVAKVSGMYQVNKAGAIGLDTRDWMLGVTVPVGLGNVLASYIQHKNKAAASADSDQIAVGYTYPLSKRTILYTSFSLVKNDANAKIQTATLGGTDKFFVAGINHSF